MEAKNKITGVTIGIFVLIIVILGTSFVIKIKENKKTEYNGANYKNEIDMSTFNAKFSSYQKEVSGIEIKELLDNVLLNIEENKTDNAKLPDIFYLAKNSEINIKSNFGDNIEILDDKDIQNILDIEAFESLDGSFNFTFDKEISFKIISEKNNTNSETISKLKTYIDDKANYYVAFKSNMSYNSSSSDGLISSIIINEL